MSVQYVEMKNIYDGMLAYLEGSKKLTQVMDELPKRGNLPDDMIAKIREILVNEGQMDTEKFQWGEAIRYTPSEVADILTKAAQEGRI